MFDLLVKNGKLVLPGRTVVDGEVGINEGKIAAVGRNLGAGHVNVDASGKLVLPGVLDTHFHVGIYRPFQEDARTESMSAIAGGVTTILSYFRTGRNYLNISEDYSSLFPRLVEMSKGNFYVDYGFNIAPITRKHVEEIETLFKLGVSTFKFYMFYKGLNLRSEYRKGSVEEEYLLSKDPYDGGHLFTIMKRISSLKGGKTPHQPRLSVHAEDAEVIRVHLEEAKEEFSRGILNALEAYSAARPPEGERVAILQAAEMARATGCPINVLHVSSETALRTIEEVRRWWPGLDVMAEVTSSHLTLTTNSKAGVLGKVNPPIRSDRDREALWEGLVSGSIQTVASDHAAIEQSRKGGELWTAENGFGATELMVPSLLTEGLRRGVPLTRLVELVTSSPAKFHGLYGRKGDLLPGFDGDLVIVDLNTTRRVRADALHSAQDFTPYEGMELRGWPTTTVLRGEIVFDSGEFSDARRGEFLKRPVELSDPA
ncbi:dihydroorotase-like protein [Sulfodiicoccus acidiphilus]|uniref:Dihydroorotase-like protein n=1 Tax=Sulfodiicoccus acidiphilus TaxID=1670455 RepID=A0A830H2V4_9CREN|nr:amidohydrolase family protein [Sulfodiicoccus acidiphilus]GGU01574.1 dihydroorotase-like protein [Sulfodiicoccus acidiphilus]